MRVSSILGQNDGISRFVSKIDIMIRKLVFGCVTAGISFKTLYFADLA
jgi:hypothetical protein